MQRRLGKAVRSRFAERLRREFPEFVPQESNLGPQNGALYGWSYAPNLTVYIALVFDSHGNPRFTVEVGWSRGGGFPLELNLNEIRFDEDEGRLRLSKLISDATLRREKGWWWLGEEPTPNSMLLDLQNVASEEYQLRKLRLQLESIPERIDDAFGLLRELTPAIFNRLKPPSVPR